MKKAIAKYYRIESAKIAPSDFPIRIVFISDLHNVQVGVHHEGLISKIDALKPDLVLLGGDTIIGKPHHSMEDGLEFIAALGARYRVYAANGNHEYRLKIYPETYGNMYERYVKTIEQANITLLTNEKANITIGNTQLSIHGLEMAREYYRRFKKGDLSVNDINNYLGTIADDNYHILLAHNPRYGKSYMAWGADLTLAGHYHGGIIRLPKDKPLIGNDFQLFPPYAYGHYEENNHHLITSAGVGEHTIPLRINNPREVVVVDLINTQNI